MAGTIPRFPPTLQASAAAGKVRSAEVCYSAEVQDHEGQAKKTFESQQNECARMSNEL
jgi:hypothetical protein